MKRRSFLGVAATASLSVVAGCQDDTEDMIEQSQEDLEAENETDGEDGEGDDANARLASR
ncbi:hypothetical protein [Halomontanus rarus]|uniref:hypothetical protein n=1 Tax=Halomontanus rarus TaxID=3034020 RepID=UPI001A993002|nr:hypothetical protein [Halovivax sp. TS33]